MISSEIKGKFPLILLEIHGKYKKIQCDKNEIERVVNSYVL